jgi:hypothetical protein
MKSPFVLIIILTISFQVAAQKKSSEKLKENTFNINSTSDFEVTGNPESKNWESVAWIDLPIKDQAKVSYSTKVKLQYSQKGIYALYYCKDKNITATITKDNSDIYNEDVVEIFFWTDEKQPVYFEYELSPLDYELVLLVPQFSKNFLGWIPWHYEGERRTRHKTTILKSDGEVTGWVAEFFIPFALLSPLPNVPPEKGTTWRMNIYRIDYDNGFTAWHWQPVKSSFHEIERYGYLTFK